MDLTIPRLLGRQFVVGAVLAATLWGGYGTTAGYSALLGSLACVVPNTFLGLRLMAPRSDAKALLRAAWIGELIKLALTVLFFSLVFTMVRPLSAAAREATGASRATSSAEPVLDRATLERLAALAGAVLNVGAGRAAEGWAALLALCESAADLFPALGLHPVYLGQHRAGHLERLQQAADFLTEFAEPEEPPELRLF